MILHTALLLASLIFMAWIGWRDFVSFRISNLNFLALLALAIAVVALDPVGAWRSSLIIGVILFAMGFVLWMAGMMGAGDAKLYLPVGMLLGLEGVGLFAFLLLAASIIFLVIIRVVARREPGGGTIRTRLHAIAEARKMPYGVPMTVAAIGAILLTM